MDEFNKLAGKVKEAFNIDYNEGGVVFIEKQIERMRLQVPEKDWELLIFSYGAFFGQCIIKSYGGQWEIDADGQAAVTFDEKNKVYPLSKVSKQFHNGLEDSVYSMYRLVPVVFKSQIIAKKKWWKFWG